MYIRRSLTRFLSVCTVNTVCMFRVSVIKMQLDLFCALRAEVAQLLCEEMVKDTGV